MSGLVFLKKVKWKTSSSWSWMILYFSLFKTNRNIYRNTTLGKVYSDLIDTNSWRRLLLPISKLSFSNVYKFLVYLWTNIVDLSFQRDLLAKSRIIARFSGSNFKQDHTLSWKGILINKSVTLTTIFTIRRVQMNILIKLFRHRIICCSWRKLLKNP